MGTIVWFWIIPVVALVPALVWASWAGRTAGRPDIRETTEQYAAWQAVLGRVQAAPADPVGAEPGTPGVPGETGPADPDAPGPAERSVS